MKRPLIVAHRGASASAPENTIAAFAQAIESGADGLEFDVRLSKDGVPVVIHDATLLRTAGINEPVAARTADELSRVDIGSWFNAAYPERARSEFARERITSLATALQLCEKMRGPIYIEIKCESEGEVPALVDAVCREIAGSRLLEKIIVKSFRLEVIPRVRAVLPGVRTAALFAPKVMRLLRKEKYLINIAREIGADHLSLHKSLVSRKLVSKAEKFGMPVTIWTVDHPRWLRRGIKLNAHAVITNDPVRLVEKRNEFLPEP
jgi:glycerophosphoryl diester phosphodiesterase